MNFIEIKLHLKDGRVFAQALDLDSFNIGYELSRGIRALVKNMELSLISQGFLTEEDL